MFNDKTVHSIFSDFYCENKIDLTKFDNSSLYEYCLNKELDKSQYNILDKSEILSLITIVEKEMNIVKSQILGINDKYKVKVKEAWINKNAPSTTTPVHLHPGFLLSAVYYVKADPTKSVLRFHHSNNILQEKIPQAPYDNVIEEFNSFNSVRWRVHSETGKLLIFPSWLKHSVDNLNTNESISDRFSIAFNASLVDLNEDSNYVENRLNAGGFNY